MLHVKIFMNLIFKTRQKSQSLQRAPGKHMVEERLLNASRNLSGDSDELYIPSLNNFPSLQSKIEENK